MKNWTVTVEGRERHDGEKPYTYVIRATDKAAAGEAVVAHHKKENEDDDVNLLEVLPGVPKNAGYHWNDLRLKCIKPACGGEIIPSPFANRNAHCCKLCGTVYTVRARSA